MFRLIRLLIISNIGRKIGKVLFAFALKKFGGKNRRFRNRPLTRW